jgi:transposase
MENKVIIGCDISKEKIDVYCIVSKESFVIKNNEEGFQKLADWIVHHKFVITNLVIGFENTGAYSKALGKFCSKLNIIYYECWALDIKQSMGVVRGKNDIIDAKRIAAYIELKMSKLIPSKPLDTSIEELKQLRTTRDTLVKHKASLLNALKISRETLKLDKENLIVQANQNVVEEMTKQINLIDEKIMQLINANTSILKSFNLLLSIVGIGKVIAVDTILATNNFEKFKTWREYASYCGCAPFTESSGKMVKKNRISKLANKSLKAHLSSGAKSAQQHDQELKIYRIRKLKEGKTNKCITNALRCKLISRMFSVIKNNRPYQRNYSHHLENSIS